MRLRIDTITEKINSFFDDNWWEVYNFHISGFKEIEAERIKFANELHSLLSEIYNILNESVFIGEYVQSDSIIEKLSAIKSLVGEINYFPPDEEVQEFFQKTLNIDFIECIKWALELYSHEALKIQKHYSFDKKDYSVYRRPFVKAFEDTTIISKASLELLNFFNHNLVLASFEHFLTPDSEDFDFLLELLHPATFEKFGANKYSNIFRERAKFLICKWITRKEHINEDVVYYLVDSIEKKGDLSEFSNNLFTYWKDYLLSHYQISTSWKSEILNSFDETKHIPYSKLSFLQLHRLIKYYKDVNKSIDNLHLVVEEFRKRFNDIKEKGTSRYDYHTHVLALSYALNNEFSLFLEDPTHTEEEIELFYQKIVQFQKSSGNYNFFPQFKYFGFLVNKLEKVYDERKPTLDFIEPAKKLIKKCREVFEKYTENAKWSEIHYNYVFQLPYDDCLINSGLNVVTKIFLPSSFLLPLPKDKDKEIIDKNAQRLTYLEASIDVFENLKVDMQHLNKVSNDVESMKKDIHTREIKSIEIIGIFTAIVTFVLGSIPTFKFVHTAAQAFLFMLSLASSLGLFVVIFFSINRGMKSIRENFKLILLILVTLLICWIFLIFSVKDPSVIQINRNDVEIEKARNDTGLIKRLNDALEIPQKDKLEKNENIETDSILNILQKSKPNNKH